MFSMNQMSFFYGKKCIFKDATIPQKFIEENGFIAIVGFNGSGKTTFLKLILGEITPFSGHIHLSNIEKLAYLPQQTQYDKTFPLTVRDVVAMGVRKPFFDFFKSANDSLKIEEMLKKVGLYELMYHPIQTLSGGQFQRMLFARMLLEEKNLFLLDEPFAAIDQKSTILLINILNDLVKNKKHILCVCHDLNLVRKYFNGIILVENKTVKLFNSEEWHAFEKKQIGLS
jgi:zinc/manganese transport system ATP-binding protein